MLAWAVFINALDFVSMYMLNLSQEIYSFSLLMFLGDCLKVLSKKSRF